MASVPVGELLQHVSRVAYRSDPLYFGRDAGNRYDDPANRYGVLYLASELSTALMESVFHKHQWYRARRTITRVEASARMVRAVGVIDDLRLANLSAPGVMASRFGLNLSQLVSRRYVHTQQISAKIHGATQADGVLYPSRNNYPAVCIALFERAQDKIRLIDDIDLVDHIDWPKFVHSHDVIVLPR
jgi:hypothetical protein